jgi:hypothetical protein
MFDRNYMDYHADRFDDHSLILYDDNDKMLAALPANSRDDILYSHQGLTFGGLIIGKRMRCPMMLEAFDMLKSYLAAESFKKLVYKTIPYFYHQQPAQEDLYALFRHGGTLVRADVSSTIDFKTQKYAFSSSRKSGLKKAREHGLQVKLSDDLETFFAIMNSVLDDKYDTQATHTHEEMALLASRFPNNIKLYGCFKDSEMLSGVIVYETLTAVHTQYIGATQTGKELGATDLVLDELINNTYTTKNYFDFGISTEDQGRVLNENLIDQKEGTGARATIYQTFELDI